LAWATCGVPIVILAPAPDVQGGCTGGMIRTPWSRSDSDPSVTPPSETLRPGDIIEVSEADCRRPAVVVGQLHGAPAAAALCRGRATRTYKWPGPVGPFVRNGRPPPCSGAACASPWLVPGRPWRGIIPILPQSLQGAAPRRFRRVPQDGGGESSSTRVTPKFLLLSPPAPNHTVAGVHASEKS